MVPEDVAREVIDALATTPRTGVSLPYDHELRVRVRGVVHVLYLYGRDNGSSYYGEYVPGLYCETPDGRLSMALSCVPLHVERVASPATPVTCVFCVHEEHRLTSLGY